MEREGTYFHEGRWEHLRNEEMGLAMWMVACVEGSIDQVREYLQRSKIEWCEHAVERGRVEKEGAREREREREKENDKEKVRERECHKDYIPFPPKMETLSVFERGRTFVTLLSTLTSYAPGPG